MSFNDVAVCSIKGNHYITQFWFMTNRETVNKMKRADQSEKSRQL